MSVYDDYGTGDAQQFFGTVAPWAQNEYSYGQDRLDLENLPAYISGQDRLDLENLPAFISGEDRVDLENLPAKSSGLGRFGEMLKGMGGKAMDFAGTPQGIMTLLAAFAALKDKRGASGGGTPMGMPAPRQYTRTMTQGQYGPIARYAAEGGLMQAYAQGGEAQAYAGGQPLMMEDGGFVFTRAASDKLGPQGIAALGGKIISAPGNGTNDKGITGIIGKHGITPARVSDKESYFPEEAVEANGGPKRMYAKMNALQRKA